MNEMKVFKMPSSAEMKMNLAPFGDSRNLYQSILKELKFLEFNPDADIDVNFIKGILCTLLSSKDVEVQVWKCMEKAVYNGERINEETFEPEEARQDYLECMLHVTWENILPFGKALFAQYSPVLEKVVSDLKR